MRKQKGYILTIELILIITILAIGSMGGIVLVRDAVIKHNAKKVDNEVVVIDSGNNKLGKAISFDEHEAPLIFFHDRSSEKTYRALIGIRDDRFTSREAIYYDAPNCQGNPCIKSVSDEDSDSSGISQIVSTGNVSYINALQNGPNYAIGQRDGTFIGNLFKSTPLSCPAKDDEIVSRYMSQKVTSGTPCESFEINKVPADNRCLVGVSNTSIDLFGATTTTELQALCDTCPEGFTSQGDILQLYLPEIESLLATALDTLSLIGVSANLDLEIGTICCPTGTVLEEDENIVETLVFTILKTAFNLLGIDLLNNDLIINALALIGIEPGITNCKTPLNLQLAEPVVNPVTNKPVLEAVTPPFTIVLPQTSSAGSQFWFPTEPKGERSND
ncbi:hypothetical protein MKZ42_12910 [Pseudoalteromonas shioyasakiensis]|uniref:Pilus assembly protein n=1 Tax=Pseudoalteromonas shioyasakiensis TaxID=1190813 RepID=A0ABT6U5U1_9GAMM|nr:MULTISPECIES: hypothetical protein [Pseudoalteromonas]MDI4671550.1 hypothetical protein [Pseudoalteromonas shioyasakiensis]MDI4674165.1 hypothetical protein [Pseudoalteromonas shioyasakiensis]MDI4688443.1 hypothetical protein [Pseudoalteromonas shioyasakiensis]MDI4707055.1 hypothetical protein [Pseudoalteromonas shioyasakiensis]NUJ23743.1 hypothetical protein [Pseudoalteromonas sp. 0802]